MVLAAVVYCFLAQTINEFKYNGGVMKKYFIWLLVFTVYAVFTVGWVSTGQLMPSIQHELSINTQQATLITTSISIAKIFGAFLAGWLVFKLGMRKGYFVGCLFISTGVFLSFADNYYAILIIRFLQGLGSACALVSLSPVTQKYFSGRQKNLFVSINITSNTIGNIIALLFAGWIASKIGHWQQALSLYSWVNLVLILIWLIVTKKEERQDSQVLMNKKNEFISVLKNRVTWGMVAYYIGPILFLNSSFLFFPTYFQEYSGLDKNSLAIHLAPALVSVAMLFAPFFGFGLKRKGVYFKRMFVISPVLTAVAGIILLVSKNDAVIMTASVMAGFFFEMATPFLFNLPVDMHNGSVEKTSYTMSVFWSLTYIIVNVNNEIIALSVDKTGSFTFGFSYMFVL
ncbi:MFS transporter, partial [Salmonella enterica]|nr:MFS transporter [Salmonella enterica]